MKRGVFGLGMVFVAGLLTGADQNVMAQDVTDCSNIINEHVRLACFDRAVSDMRERGSPAAPGSPVTGYGQPPPSQFPAPQYPPPYGGGQPGYASGGYQTYAPLPAYGGVQNYPVPPVSRLPEQTYTPMMPQSPPIAARVVSPEIPVGVVRSRVISHDRIFKKYVLVLENGQVWKQTGGGVRLPFPEDGPAYALVRETGHDGFLLSLEGSRKTIPVKRLK